MPRVVIIGAGLAGLATAFRLRQRRPDIDLTVLEAQPRAGGVIGTFTNDGFTWESGPNGFLDSKPGMMNLCQDLGLKDNLIAASEGSRKNRFLCLDGRLVKLPSSPQGLLGTKALSLRGKLSLLCEPFRRKPALIDPDETVHAFATRRFGKEAADTIVDALVTGIHGGDPKRLSVAAAFPRLVQWETDAGSVIRGVLRNSKQKRRAAEAKGEPKPGPPRMWSFPGGLQVVTDTLAKQFQAELKLGTPVTNLAFHDAKWVVQSDRQTWLADHVVLTAPAFVQAELVKDVNAALAAELDTIAYTKIAVVALGYRRAAVPQDLDGFGYIAPQNTRRDVLGVQWCSSIFPGRAPDGHVLWRALCGGMHRGDVLDWDDETLTAKVHAEMQAVMGVTAPPSFVRIQRWPRAIPQYEVGHLARAARCRSLAGATPGLHLAGNAFDGVALNDVCEQAERIAAAMWPGLQAGRDDRPA